MESCLALDRPMTLNGILNEWGDLRAFAPLAIQSKKTGGNNLFCKTGYFKDRLYFAFLVEDTELVGHDLEDETKIVRDDCIELFIACRKGAQGPGAFPVYYAALGVNSNKRTQICEIKDDLINWGKERKEFPCDVYVRALGTVNQMDDTDQGMVVELSIPLPAINISPVQDREFFLEIGSRDNDLTSSTLQRLSGDNDEKVVFKNWCRIVFEQPGIDGAGGKKRWWAVFGLIFLVVLTGMVVLVFRVAGRFRIERTMRQKLRNELNINLSEYIEDNFKADISLEKFCAKYGLALRTTQDWIKKNMNTTFNQLLTNRRMKEAKNLLEGSDRTVAEICYQVGYNHTSYFANTFKKLYGKTPSEVQAEARKG